MTVVYAWARVPDGESLAAFLTRHTEPKQLVFCLPDTSVPVFRQPETPSDLCAAWHEAIRCLTFDAVNFIAQWLPNTDLWLMPPHAAAHLSEHFSQSIQWQTGSITQNLPTLPKAWQMPPSIFRQPETPHVIIIGAGIAGAATAYECALRGAHVTVLEARSQTATAASGNRQGLLYAKISPHLTLQTELLLAGYGYTRRLLQRLLPDKNQWDSCGVLHLNHNAAETVRNQKLSQNQHYKHLYTLVSVTEASILAGVTLPQGGLFWQHGAWLNPPALVDALLQHKNITLHTNSPVLSADFDREFWHIATPHTTFSGSHVVFCTGADSVHTPITNEFPWQFIRGQTSLVHAHLGSLKLKIALSGASYISPSWNGIHCFGATFFPNDNNDMWHESDELANRDALTQLCPTLAPDWHFSGSLKGHAAVRCDSYDHLPAVGALGDVAAIRRVYAQLAYDKNYRVSQPCPYLPRAYVNTAHGSRGLATAPLCAADIAAQICVTPRPLSDRLKNALNPNRLIIREMTHHKK